MWTFKTTVFRPTCNLMNDQELFCCPVFRIICLHILFFNVIQDQRKTFLNGEMTKRLWAERKRWRSSTSDSWLTDTHSSRFWRTRVKTPKPPWKENANKHDDETRRKGRRDLSECLIQVDSGEVRQADPTGEEKHRGKAERSHGAAPVSEPGYCATYARMCRPLVGRNTASESSDASLEVWKLLLHRCQQEFPNNLNDDEAFISGKKRVHRCSKCSWRVRWKPRRPRLAAIRSVLQDSLGSSSS